MVNKALVFAFAALASAQLLSRNHPGVPHSGGHHGAPSCAICESNQPAWYKRNLKTIQDIYDLTVYPANAVIIKEGSGAVPPGLFAEDAIGRVSPVGNFSGFQDSIEYFFALAPVVSGASGNAIYRAEVVDFVSACPEVASSLVYLRTGTVSQEGVHNASSSDTTLSQVAFWHFDSTGAVDKYQAWIPNLQAWVLLSSGVDFSNVVIQKAVEGALCPQIQKNCVGNNTVYSSVADCTATLMSKPFGNFDEAWGDNVACRTIHTLLTVVRPEVHCPHVSRTGGGKCVNIDYSDDYFDDAELYGKPLGSTFTCAGQIPPSSNHAAQMAMAALANQTAG